MKGRRLLFRIYAAAAVSVMFFSGFADTGTYNNDNNSEETARLLSERTRLMQKCMFDSSADREKLFTQLADIECHPLLSEDFEALVNTESCGADRIINMNIREIICTSFRHDSSFYEVETEWFMSGNEGCYSEICIYTVKTVSCGGRIYLSEIILN